MEFDLTQVLSVTLILFGVIDIIGSIPIVLDIKNKGITIESGKATLVAGAIMILFLFFGDNVLDFLE